MNRVSVQPAFVLHKRPYRETSLILELFTPDYGRVSAVGRGIRQAKSRSAGLLQPFMPLCVSWAGRSELLNLQQVEGRDFFGHLSAHNLRCGLYMNELLMRVLPKQDAHANLFVIYERTLHALAKGTMSNEIILRVFEKQLLQEIGYGLPLKAENIDENLHYRFDMERGFLLECQAQQLPSGKIVNGIFSGLTLKALLLEQFNDSALLPDIKRLMRTIFGCLLGDKPLNSRSLFVEEK